MKKLVVVLILSFACMNIHAQGIFSNPEKDGKNAAIMVNNYYTSCINNVRKCESDFVKNFNADNYTSRKQANNAYRAELKKVFEKHSQNIDAAKNHLYEMEVKYEKNESKWQEFKKAYNDNIDKSLQNKVASMKKSKKIPAPVAAKIKTVIPSYPGAKQMQKDLVGQSLSEGVSEDEAWFDPEWRLKIKKGQIKNFKVLKVVKKTNKEYSVLASMTIVTPINSFSAKVQINYILPEIDDWKIEFVLSKGVKLNKTGKYDDCISCKIEPDGWGGTYALYITNKVDMELAVAGYIYSDTYDKWQKFAIKVAPNEKEHQVGGLFCGGSVSDYKIEYVERL